jgi:cholesterol transport system auxiliary component
MNTAFRLLALAAVGATAGCGGLLQSNATPDQTYLLRAAVPANASAPALSAPSLRIGRTLTAPGLDSDRIVLVRSDHRVDYYASSRWADSIPQMMEDLAADTLRGSGAWSSVHDSRGAFGAEYYLQIDIRRFEADYTQGAAPIIHVVLNCALGRRTERDLLASFSAEGTANASENRLSSVVAAFESATQTALATVAERAKEALLRTTSTSTVPQAAPE